MSFFTQLPSYEKLRQSHIKNVISIVCKKEIMNIYFGMRKMKEREKDEVINGKK